MLRAQPQEKRCKNFESITSNPFPTLQNGNTICVFQLLHSTCPSYRSRPRSEPYDPYVPRGSPSNSEPRPGNPKTAAIQDQINSTVDIMKSNINKVAERGGRIDDLQDKTGEFVGYYDWCSFQATLKVFRATNSFPLLRNTGRFRPRLPTGRQQSAEST